jgi:hypothetical protein
MTTVAFRHRHRLLGEPARRAQVSAPRRVLDSEGRDPPLFRTILVLYAALVVVVTVVMTLAFVIPYLVL